MSRCYLLLLCSLFLIVSPPTSSVGVQALSSCGPINIKYYGERNTGTNYLETLIQANFPQWNILLGSAHEQRLPPNEFFSRNFKTTLGWKHRKAPATQDITDAIGLDTCVVFLYISKNPYAWVLSMYDHPYHYGASKPRTYDKFVRSPYKSAGSREGDYVRAYDTPMELFNVKYNSYVALPEPKMLITYESLLDDPEAAMRALKDGAVEKCSALLKDSCTVKPLPEDWSFKLKTQLSAKIRAATGKVDKGIAKYKDRYVGQTWKKDYRGRKDLIAFMNQKFDLKLLENLGYAVLNPQDFY